MSRSSFMGTLLSGKMIDEHKRILNEVGLERWDRGYRSPRMYF